MIEKCEMCGSPNLASISMTLSDGSQLQMTSCHRCEAKVWEGPEGRVPLGTVLAMAAERRPQD